MVGQIVNAPSYSRNSDLHGDLEIDTNSKNFEIFWKRFEQQVQQINVETIELLDNVNLTQEEETIRVGEEKEKIKVQWGCSTSKHMCH